MTGRIVQAPREGMQGSQDDHQLISDIGDNESLRVSDKRMLYVSSLTSPWAGWTPEAGTARLLSSLGTPAESAAVARPSNSPIPHPSGRARSAGGRGGGLREIG